MQLWRQIGKQRWAKVTIGVVAAEYLRFVGMTTRFTLEPADIYARGEKDMPIILAFWHGQHLLAPVARKIEHKVNMLVSRHRDGEINAVAAQRLGVGTIRGSGNHGGGFVHKAGVAAFQAMLESLAGGSSIALSADVPKVARVAGLGIIKLAQVSGRPIYPSAIATSRRIVLDNWDRTTINLPFGRGAGVAAEPIRVPAEADDSGLEAARLLLEDRLNAATRRAYQLVDKT
ncbi:MAG: lysophospholipid acyltransferase family protein [Xanthobacteraceae bacterium]